MTLDELAEQALAKVRRQLFAEPEKLKRILRGFLEQAAEAATQAQRDEVEQAHVLREAVESFVAFVEERRHGSPNAFYAEVDRFVKRAKGLACAPTSS